MKKILVLGSSSAYRRELLGRLKINFTIISPNIDETPLTEEKPAATALRLARLKAIAAGQHWIRQCTPTEKTVLFVIGSDQVATVNDLQIGKPGGHDQAVKQLTLMSNQTVVFHSALCLAHTLFDPAQHIDPDQLMFETQLANVPTTVKFRPLTHTMIEHYLQLDQPYDCAGSAKAESLGIALTESISADDPTALTGLPLITLCSMLGKAGFSVIDAAHIASENH